MTNNQQIYNYVQKSIEKHLCEVEHQPYEQLTTIFDETTLKALSNALETHQDEKFRQLLDTSLTHKEIKMKLLLLIDEHKQPSVRTKSLSFNKQTKRCTLFYGTNREPNNPDNLNEGYGNQRANRLHLGVCDVLVPESRNRGETKGSLWNKIIKFDASYGDLQLQSITAYKEASFWSTISALFSPLEEEEKSALIFIHGYNTSFEGAAIRAAQLSTDLEHSGLTAFFSWPSKGSLLGYVADEASIQYSERFISQFLTDFVEHSGAKRVHIIAHSMGNRGLLKAMNRITISHPEIQFGQIILAAPDVDADVFKELAEVYPKHSEQTTLYVSAADKAVGASKWVHSHARAGFTPPVSVVNNIDTIQVETDVDLLQLGHGYFAQHHALLDDIDKLFATNLCASDRQELLQEVTQTAQNYWKIRE